MYTNTYTHLRVARDRQCELIEQAERQRIARQLRDLARASRPAGERPLRRTWRAALRLGIHASA
jgi:hypothetical protein